MKPSQRYQRDAELMKSFREAYIDLINHATQKQAPSSLYLTVLGPSRGISVEAWNAKRSAVAMSAGAASRTYPRYGGTFTLRNAAYVTNNVDPVANWEMSLKDPEQFPPETVLGAVEAGIATAGQEAADAALRERGLTGLIAAFLRWPSNLTEAVGSGRSPQRAVAGVIGIVGQLMVATVGGALAVGLAAGAVALWELAF